MQLISLPANMRQLYYFFFYYTVFIKWADSEANFFFIMMRSFLRLLKEAFLLEQSFL